MAEIKSLAAADLTMYPLAPAWKRSSVTSFDGFSVRKTMSTPENFPYFSGTLDANQ
jgi:hypothetical protein